jgi:hypothetical protein
MVGASLFAECFMDHLINFMSSNRFYSLPLFNFLLTKNTITFLYYFFTPYYEIDYSEENFSVKEFESGSVLCELQVMFYWFSLQLIVVVIE